MNTMIHATGLTRVFGPTTAVRDVSFDVAPGEVFALLGPNGSGKTTTVRMLAALIAPSGGDATVVGARLSDGEAARTHIRAHVGLLTESPGLYERLSAYYNLLYFARLYGVAQPQKQVEKYLKLLELWDRRDDPTGGFSKGMKQKVAIARALLHEPELLFLDEPTSGLDPSAAKTVRDFLEELKAEGRTIFLTTHNLDEAERLADRVAVLRQSLIAVDTPTALRQRLFGARSVVQLANPDPRFVQLARGLPGAQHAELQAGELRVDWADGAGSDGVSPVARHNPALIAALVAQGAEIQFVTEARASLEQVYLELVENAAAAPTGTGRVPNGTAGR